ncbi:hypothetical protein HU200_029106 [Digitaria exilis]|uniref:Uncharacterized protein n=1 Tax=Digitaria exilis TaxID=1010633 RepID=A0A835BQC6_9POAL|nr:hypothetical protein HU200_029106 [Digitaria exilis]CAB3489275.1 unnamed protein product [Digitaria exilis]
MEPVPIVDDEASKGYKLWQSGNSVIAVGALVMTHDTLYHQHLEFWTMNLSVEEPLMWVKDGEMDCKEL